MGKKAFLSAWRLCPQPPKGEGGVEIHCQVRTLRLDMDPVPGAEDTEVTV